MRTLTSVGLQTITDLAEQKVQYLGLQSFRMRNFSSDGEVPVPLVS